MRRTIVLPDGDTIPFSFTMGCAFMGEVASRTRSVWGTRFFRWWTRMYRGKNVGRGCIVTGADTIHW